MIKYICSKCDGISGGFAMIKFMLSKCDVISRHSAMILPFTETPHAVNAQLILT